MKSPITPVEIPQHLRTWWESVAKLKWQKFTLRNSAAAAFAKALWLDLPAQDVVAAIEAHCRPHDPTLNAAVLWKIWSATESQLNGTTENQELEAA